MGPNKNWELQFPEAILAVEELLSSENSDISDVSKLKIALENSFLTWSDYQKWATDFYGRPSLENLTQLQISDLKKYQQKIEDYNSYSLWNKELVPLCTWDGNLIVLGLEYDEEILSKIPQAIFIFCRPEILADLSKTATPPPTVDLLSIKNSANESQIWQNINSQHEDFSVIARKHFDAYLVLRVTPDQKTELYKMDEDLERENLDKTVFAYDLKDENPFANVYQNHFTETFNINQLNLKLLDFKYTCISAIKLGPKVVGFLVGFKTTHLSQDDITTLESISEKAV